MYFPIFVLIVFTKYLNVKCEVIKDPTLKPGNMDLEEDIKTLNDEFDRDITVIDRNEVCRIVFLRTYAERIKLRDTFDSTIKIKINSFGYKEQFKSVTDIFSRISDNNLDKLYEISFIPWEDILVGTVRDTITGADDHSPVIEEAMCAEDNDMKKRILNSYQTQFNVALEQDFVQYKQDDVAYHEAMTKYCLPERAPDLRIPEQIAIDEANALRQIGGGNDKEAFKTKLKEILGKYTEGDLKLIFQKYRKEDDDGIDTTVGNVFEGNERLAYSTLVRYIENTCKYYADALHDSMDGFGTDNNRINRIVLTRCERDLACIHREYKNIHGETYTNRLSDDTSELRYLEAIRYLSGKSKDE